MYQNKLVKITCNYFTAYIFSILSCKYGVNHRKNVIEFFFLLYKFVRLLSHAEITFNLL